MICRYYRFSFHLEVEETSHELLVNFKRNSRGNSILKMVLASTLYQFEIGVCEQSITILKLLSNSHQYQFWNWCLPAINSNFEIGVKQPSISILKMVSASNQYQFEIGVCQWSIKILKLVSNSHQYPFWKWCLPAINNNFEIGVKQPSMLILKLVSASSYTFSL